jgi:hypothetical protein
MSGLAQFPRLTEERIRRTLATDVRAIRSASLPDGPAEPTIAAISRVRHESGCESTDHLRTKTVELSAPQRSTMDTSDK